jgi:hypothetical protein
VQSGDEIEEQFADPDPDQVFEKPTPQPLEENGKFVCLVCGAAFATHDQLTIHNFVKHELSTGDLIPERHTSTYIEMDR